MASLMFDSDNPAVLLDSRFAGCRIATYADLLTPQLVTELGPRLVVIDRGQGDPLNLATVADCEAGLLSVAEAAAKVQQWTAEHRPFPTVYHDRDLWPEVDQALLHIGGWHWVATLDGTLNPDGRYPAAVQFTDEAKVGLHVDVSIVWNDSYHPAGVAIGPAQLSLIKSSAAAVLISAEALANVLKTV